MDDFAEHPAVGAPDVAAATGAADTGAAHGTAESGSAHGTADAASLTSSEANGQLARYVFHLPAGTRTAQHPTRPDIRLLGLDFNAAPLEPLGWMRANAPVYWDDNTGIWGITRHADIMRIEADSKTFCSVLGSRPESSVP